MRTIGVDIHRSVAQIAFLEGGVIKEQRRLASERATLLRRRMRVRSRINGKACAVWQRDVDGTGLIGAWCCGGDGL